LVLPLLGGSGDSPIIPVEVNEKSAAMFLSPGLIHVLVRNGGGLFYRSGTSFQMKAQDGKLADADNTVIDTLRLSNVRLYQVPAALIRGTDTRHIGGLPITGFLGRDFLQNAEILLDVPHAKVALFHWRDGPGCDVGPSLLFEGAVYAVPMDSDARLQLKIGKTEVKAQLDPDLETSVLPKNIAVEAGMSDSDLNRGKKNITIYESIVVGQQHIFNDVQIGAFRDQTMNFIVQKDLERATLGGDFFANKTVLFDFPHNMFIFQSSADQNDHPVLHLHFDETREGTTSVEEGKGNLN